MINYVTGNLLEAQAEALVNTVNTDGIMGKGIALQFKERFRDNFDAYATACKHDKVRVGEMFVEPTGELGLPRYIINFPTKKSWRLPSRVEWIEMGLHDLVRVVRKLKIKSIAIPPLGCGNGGLDWAQVQPVIESALSVLSDVEVIVFQPTGTYQNVAKREGVEALTPARALLIEVVRRYLILGFECSNLELHKLAYFLQRLIRGLKLHDELQLHFAAGKYGPYADNLRHVLHMLDGSYLHCPKRLADAGPYEPITLDFNRLPKVESFLEKEGIEFQLALNTTDALIDGFQSPYHMELLSTVDWIQLQVGCPLIAEEVIKRLARWPGEISVAKRKMKLFDMKAIEVAQGRLQAHREVLYPQSSMH